MKTIKRMVVIMVLIIILIGAAFFLILKFVKPADYQFAHLHELLTDKNDGVYSGYSKNGPVQVRVNVIVNDEKIEKIDILEHDHGLGGPAETIIDEVTRNQTLEVDAVSGATYSSQTILKAVEDALK